MTVTRRSLALMTLGAAGLAALGVRAASRTGVIVARGAAAGGWPAGSRGAFDAAANDGADFLETGVVPTKDGVPVARQDNELSADTDIAAHAEYADRRATRVIGGITREGWFCEDFTLAELKSLTLTGPGRAPKGERPAILTLDELMRAAQAACVRTARTVGVYVDLIAPAHFATLGIEVEAPLASVVRSQGYDSPAAALWIASEDAGALKTLGGMLSTRRARRLPAEAETGALSDPRAFAAGAAAIALPAGRLLDVSNPKALEVAPLLGQIQAAGLQAHAWTGGAGAPPFPPPPLRGGDARRAFAALWAAGADAIVGDSAATLARARVEASRT